MFEKIKNKIKKTQSPTRLCVIMGAVFTACIIPMLVISFYSHPAGDDYHFGADAHLAWESTHSIAAVLEAAVNTAATNYQTWQGTFTSIFLMALQPAVISQRLYCLTTFMMLGMLIASVLFLFYVIFTYYLPIKKSVWLICALSVLLMCTQVLEAGVDAFYWYNGAVHYCFMHSCMVFMAAFFLYFLKTPHRIRAVLSFLASCLMAFVTGGSNYVTALVTPIIFVFIMLFCLIGKQKKTFYGFIPLAVNLVCFALNILAPGNSVRMAAQTASSGGSSAMGAFEAVYYSFLYAIDGIAGWSSVYLLFLTLLTLPFLFKELYRLDFKFPMPGIPAAVSYCIISASYTPSLYSMGHGIMYDRTVNIMRMLFYLLFFANLVYTTGWITVKMKKFGITQERCFSFLSKLKHDCGKSFAVGMTVFFMALIVFSDKDDITSLSAIDSLRKGYAQSYHEECLYRISLLSMEGVDEVWVPNLTVTPPLLPEQVMSAEDTDNYVNRAIAKWFGLETVHLSEIY